MTVSLSAAPEAVCGLPGAGVPPLGWLVLAGGLVVLGSLFVVAIRRRRLAGHVTDELALVDSRRPPERGRADQLRTNRGPIASPQASQT